MIIFFAALAGLVAWGLHLGWRWKQTRDFAPEVLATKQAEGELPADVSVADFTDLYVRSEGPRAATYFFVCGAFMLVFLAPFVSLFNELWRLIWRLSGQNPVFETGTLIHSFSIFLAFMLVAIALLAAAMHRYYAVMPPTLKQVIRDLNGGHS
ncbi:hypothetical protein [Hyphomonas pacifica]|uniref:Uncharacterized protein n=1 Tax=Hyphomonas pacifica TaxID=1280941 RepID=A0A062TZF1_9PROT|nr:hypothetical protein [Hyphomonas pacifica]KCZ46258.1 hypothetical protein HY2_06130 [Hyphomonas pacifica]RAN31465.1 hypothetical protein HY11_06785 [Hyphomonas pacifica]RAN35860.1 hypothetical protein HY3_07105 [Hyphomonas pacifica]